MATATTPARQVGEQDEVILRAEGITKVFSGTVALSNVDFNVYKGKVNVLIGENGAGKSTLMKILAGVEQPTEGRISLEGKDVQIRSTREAARLGIGIIFQELNLFPNLSIAENIFMARERTTRTKTIDVRSQEAAASEVLDRLQHSIDPGTPVSDLPIGMQQIVEIAKALIGNARILIMDEPTSALSNVEVGVLFNIIRELKAQGVSIIYISHKLDELMQIGDYITVLRDGKLVAEAPASQVNVPWIIDKMVGHQTKTRTRTHKERGAELLRVENLSLARPGSKGLLLDSVSLSLYAGEILGIYGLMGAGRTELFECLIGLREHSAGAIYMNGKPVKTKAVTDRIKVGLMLVPEDRQRVGLVQTMSVSDNMTLASLGRYTRGGYLSSGAEHSKVRQYIKELSIKVSQPSQPITSLSGGNQQKVVVGKGLLTSPKVLLLDEPTRGIDVAAKAEMFEIMSNLAEQGLGVLFVSSELTEVLSLSDRVLVMSKGRITGEFTGEEATEEALVAASAIGHGLGADTENGPGAPSLDETQGSTGSTGSTDNTPNLEAAGTAEAKENL